MEVRALIAELCGPKALVVPTVRNYESRIPAPTWGFGLERAKGIEIHDQLGSSGKLVLAHQGVRSGWSAVPADRE